VGRSDPVPPLRVSASRRRFCRFPFFSSWSVLPPPPASVSPSRSLPLASRAPARFPAPSRARRTDFSRCEPELQVRFSCSALFFSAAGQHSFLQGLRYRRFLLTRSASVRSTGWIPLPLSFFRWCYSWFRFSLPEVKLSPLPPVRFGFCCSRSFSPRWSCRRCAPKLPTPVLVPSLEFVCCSVVFSSSRTAADLLGFARRPDLSMQFHFPARARREVLHFLLVSSLRGRSAIKSHFCCWARARFRLRDPLSAGGAAPVPPGAASVLDLRSTCSRAWPRFFAAKARWRLIGCAFRELLRSGGHDL
jgi:hypothetical protein